MRLRSTLILWTGILGAAGIAIALVILAPRPQEVAASETTAITVDSSSCGTGWTGAGGGHRRFVVTNTSLGEMDVDLQDPASGAVFGEIEALGPSSSASLTADLGDGDYRFVCFPGDGPTVIGPSAAITGTPPGTATTPGVVPVTASDLVGPARSYADGVADGLTALGADVGALTEAIDRGDTAAARGSWLTAHLRYERLGAAYGAFGDADAAIDAELGDGDSTGFRALARELWGGGATPEAGELARQLTVDVADLAGSFDPERFDPLDLGIRAHEIMEDTLRAQLVRDADAVSGTTLATVRAHLDGTLAAVDPLSPLLSARGYDVQGVEDAIRAASAQVDGFETADGWRPLAQTTRAERTALNATLSALTEQLAPIAAICDIRKRVAS